ncbi:MAG TPA: CBS domain-containing protein [Stellaceae bacterium]|nr:CBS domain-containing protein [Stellaceae bacterium]
MNARDVMTTEVITVNPETTVQALAALLSEKSISGAPVVDATGRLVGIVSEGDLLHRAETGTERRVQHRRSWWLDSVAAEEEAARDYVKAHGRTVNDIMSRNVVSVSETTELGEIAHVLETKKVKRVPVVRDGRVVGIVSRANLVRALATTSSAPAIVADSDDRTIRVRLLDELKSQRWANVWDSDIMVRDRVVHVWIADDQPSAERDALRVAAENIPGVQRVEEHIVPAPVLPAF